MINKYVVVKEREIKAFEDSYSHGGSYNFSRFHNTIEEARKEAERLCRKENHPFLVLQVIGKCSIDNIPVKWEE